MRKFNPNDHVGIYLRDLTRWHREAKEILADCDDVSRQWLIVSYLPYALFLAKRFREFGVDFEDLIQVANMAVISAVDDFITEKGKLSNFVAARVRAALWKEIRTRRTCVKTPERIVVQFSVVTMNKRRKRGGGDRSTLIPQQEQSPPIDTSQLDTLMGVLTETDRRIISKRLQGMNRNEVAKEERVTPQAIGYYEKRALSSLFDAAGADYNGETLQELDIVKAHNRKNKRLVMITAFGETKCLAEWCREFRIKNPYMLKARLEQGMSSEDALMTPSQRA